MRKTAAQFRAEKASSVEKAAAINARAEAEHRDLTDIEQTEFDEHITRAQSLDADISRADRTEALEGARSELRRSQGRRVPAHDGGFETPVDRAQVLRSWFLAGTEHADHSSEAQHRARAAGVNLFGKTITLRALASGTAPGSNLTAGSTANIMVEALRSRSPLLGRVSFDITSDGTARVYPTADDTGNEAVIVDENTEMADQDPDFGGVSIATYLYSSKLVKASIAMLQDSQVNLETYIFKTVAERIRQALEKHYTIGTGTGQPYGLKTSVGAGVANAAAADPTWAMVIDLEHSVAEQYRDSAAYIVSDDALKRLKKLVDGNDRPLWQPSAAVGVPSTINGKPYIVSPHLDPWGTSKTPMMFGDPASYQARQVLDITITRLDERFAELGQVAWVALARFGGRWTGPTVSFKKLTTASS